MSSAKVQAKKFVPNLNVNRKVSKKTEVADVKENKVRHNKRKEFKKERHDRRDKPQFIQTSSVFAEGMGAGGLVKRRQGGGGGDYSDDGGAEGGHMWGRGYDKEEEERKLKALMRDDFIDNLTSGSHVPVQLPMVDTGKIFVKNETVKSEQLATSLKKEMVSDEETDDLDLEDKVNPPLTSSVAVKQSPVETNNNVGEAINANAGDMFLIQLPDHLPMLSEDDNHLCSLDSLSEGQVGQLLVRKSGKVQLVLGDHVMNVELGTKAGFLEEAVNIELSAQEAKDHGHVTSLGQVHQRLVVSPDWDSLLNCSMLNSSLA